MEGALINCAWSLLTCSIILVCVARKLKACGNLCFEVTRKYMGDIYAHFWFYLDTRNTEVFFLSFFIDTFHKVTAAYALVPFPSSRPHLFYC